MTQVAIAYDDFGLVAADDAPGIESAVATLEAVESVERACASAGWRTTRIEVGSGRPAYSRRWHEALLADIDAAQPDVIVNLIESVDGDSRLEIAACWILELARIPYTGAPPRALALALEKPVTKAVLQSRGVPVARGVVLENGDEPLPPLRWPLIVKPVREDGSNGITQESVVGDERALRERARWVHRTFGQAALAEEYVDGREINVAILGDRSLEVLPLAEIDFTGFPEGSRRIVTYDAKWNEGSAECLGTASVGAAPLDAGVHEEIVRTALVAHRAVGVRDYARIDMRLDPERGPLVLEVNPNPDCTPGAGLCRTAERAGISHEELIQRIVRSAIERGVPERAA